MSRIEIAKKMLRDNNSIGMSAHNEPIEWNLHQAIDCLIDAVEELEQKNEGLEIRLRAIEKAFIRISQPTP